MGNSIKVNQKELIALWNKAKKVEGKPPAIWRKDIAGAWIRYDQYGKRTPYGWEVSYIRPLSKGGNRDFDNLQLLHWRNNKYKGEDYHVCRTCVSSDGNVNIEKIRIWQIE